MSKHAAKKIAKTLGLSAKDAFAYGSINGVFISIRNDAFTASLTVIANALTKEQISKIREYGAQNKKKLLLRDISYEQPYLRFFLDSHYAPLTAKSAAKTAGELAAYIGAMGVVSACASCGRPEAAPAYLPGAVVYICDECYERQKEASAGALEERKVSGSYFKGLLGAITGGFIGVVPWVIFGLLGRIAAVSGFIMAYACVKLYTAFRGRVGKPMTAIIIFVLICFTVLGVFASWVVTALQEGFQDFGGVMEFVFHDMTITGIPGDIIIGLLLAGLGAFFLLRGVFITASGKDLSISRDASK